MKIKALSLVLILALTLSMSSCLTINDYQRLDLKHEKSELEKIEIYNTDVLDEDSVFYGYGEEDEPYNIENLDDRLDPILTLQGEEAEEFYDRISNMTFSNFFIIIIAAIDSFYGYSGYLVKLTFIDGDTAIISSSQQYYSIDGEISETNLYFVQDWTVFIEEYISTAE